MTTLREAAQQALEALDCPGKAKTTDEQEAITALRSALAEHFCDTHCTWADHAPGCVRAEPVQEPVAWRWGYRSITTGEMDWRGYVEIAADPNLRSPAIIMQPLYTSPPQRKPLTEEEIQELSQQHKFDSRMEKFVRIIERAHGIGGQNE